MRKNRVFFSEELVTKFRQKFEKRGLSVKEAASMLDVSRNVISKLCFGRSGKVEVHQDYVPRLMRFISEEFINYEDTELIVKLLNNRLNQIFKNAKIKVELLKSTTKTYIFTVKLEAEHFTHKTTWSNLISYFETKRAVYGEAKAIAHAIIEGMAWKRIPGYAEKRSILRIGEGEG